MKKVWKLTACAGAIAMGLLFGGSWNEAQAAQDTQDTVIADNVYIGEVAVGGMTEAQAQKAVEEYVDELLAKKITLTADENTAKIKASKLGVEWANTDVVDEALHLGEIGNIVSRYKEIADLENGSKTIPLTFSVDEDEVAEAIESKTEKLNTEPVDYSLKRTNGSFEIVEGKDGVVVDVEASVQLVKDFVENEWSVSDTTVALEVEVEAPGGSEEELAKVQDVLGKFSTDYSSSAAGRAQNVANGASKINGTIVYPGETFSVYDTVSPFEAENGYALAGSYENGTTVETYGGGICQVSTTLYNAVIRAELEVVERYAHSMLVSYVDPSADAAIAGTYKDFKFTNNTDAPIYIEGVTSGGIITFTVYGEETRDSNREVSFVSETTSTTEPETQYKASSAKIGSMTTVQNSHIGKTAILWKVVTVDGVEQSREQFNSSTYKASPTIIEVGTASSSSEATAAVKKAIATQDASKIKAAIAANTDEALEKAAKEDEEDDSDSKSSKKSDSSDSSSSKKKSSSSDDE
ncbi:VanW family protein [Eubacterium oxidoreducens]|uniref:Vancomycin resistance protein YoaR, contains peptidoglycan-binding and VanW domains n=1 Tax=Eubacterium oxidoreducens TaxID=1732 RepID=A0A1G6CDY1_EUBOX|nr:VanW family protein [Eubacterium oxidoreducens]SDB31089.1 Vancomycin resistance protein YoaR, contains peptidoglycan-binding and VanW domains [Eubacterium oxidoreducens]